MEIPIFILYIYIFILYIIYYICIYYILYVYQRVWWFPKSWSYPQFSKPVTFHPFSEIGFSMKSTIQVFGYPHLWKSPFLYIIYIYIIYYICILYVYQRVWWFPKSWSYPQFSKPVTFHPFSEIGFSMKSTIQVFGYPHLWKSP